MPLVLALDLGSSALKALIFSTQGQVMSRASSGYPTYAPKPGHVEQKPGDWLRAMGEAVGRLPAGERAQVEAISFSGQMSSLVLLDSAGEPLAPCVTISDARADAQCRRFQENAGEMLGRITGNAASNAFWAPKVMWMLENEPETMKRAAYCVFAKDYLRAHLTGRVATEDTDAGNSLLLDPVTRQWNPELVAQAGIPPRLLPRVLAVTDIAGGLLPGPARALGLKAGIPVVAGGADIACAALGIGAVEQGDTALTLGTCATIFTVLNVVSPVGRGQVTYHPHAVPGRVYALGSHFTGGQGVNWFCGMLGGKPPHADYGLLAQLAAEAQASPIGANGVAMLPFLVGSGSPYFRAQDRAAWVGMTLASGRSDLFRALLEGITYNLRQSYTLFQRINPKKGPLRLGGGGVNLPLWPQMICDVFGAPVQIVEDADASAIGAGLIAAKGAGMLEDMARAAGGLVSVKRELEPDSARHARYGRFEALNRRCYEALTPIFQEMEALRTEDETEG